ncbi:uncharacterized protein TA13320 [Theileria annulata]|uniref:FHA domain-containing protein n=1 Tax=Theileria annulata TaxID=5874 RepID=Q4UEG8_THEAN|nr:uncharacterized protein TA13320 [Theileria annulata]CAI74521.1 hypothetical protein, conserved [Theileria annulata]|eukprot:XP_952253.1 hypothetical protein, conserved [Theileria annulata]
METHSEVFKKLGTHVTCALQEVGAQLKFHAKHATNELVSNLDNFKTPFCGKLTNEMNCSLFQEPNSNTLRQTQVKTSGNYKFGFEINLVPQDLGVLSVSVSGADVSSFNFTWRRVLYSYECQLDHVSGPTYKLTADDVGTTIAVKCNLKGSDEEAEAEIGPIDIDVRSKRLIQEALINNTSRHQLYLVEVNSEKVQTGSDYRHFILYLLSEEVVLKPEDNLAFNFRTKCRFGTDYPRVTLDLEDELKFYLEFDQSLKYTLRVYNKNQRDSVVLMIRVFHSRVLLNNCFENNQTELTRDGRLDLIVNKKTFSLNSVIQRQAMDLSNLILENSRLERELERSKQEKSFLELEMKNTIQVFQEQIAKESVNSVPESTRLRVHEETSRHPGTNKFLSRQTTSASGYSDVEPSNNENQGLYMELFSRNASLNEKLSLLTKENSTEKNRLEKQCKCVLKDYEKMTSENEQLLSKMGELRSKIKNSEEDSSSVDNEADQHENKDSTDNSYDWKLLETELPISIHKKGNDFKSNLVYKPPGWSCISPDPKILEFSIQIISNGVILETVKLGSKSHYILGSLDDCDFVYKNPQVSRKHFVLHYTRSNSLVIYDLNSTTGTTVNHKQLLPEKYYLLSLGDQIRIGKPGLSTRSYIITGHSIFSEVEDVLQEKLESMRKKKKSDVDKVKIMKKIEKELEKELKITKVEESYYDTSLFLDEYDEYLDENPERHKRKQTVMKKSDILLAILKLQKSEIQILNNWYTVLKDATPDNYQLSKESASKIDFELEKVKKKQLKEDKLNFQRDLDRIRGELDHNFKLLRVASY